MFPTKKLVASACALALGLSATQAVAGASSNDHGRGDRAKAHEAVRILDRPGRHFRRSIAVWRRHHPERDATTGYQTPEDLGVSSGTLDAIASCESGGNPAAIASGGAYRGKYQFDYGTWASVGGSGDPATAPEDEQDMRAAMLYARAGSSPWPICGV